MATPKLSLPYIAASQSQKEVTHNEALNVIDLLLDRSVLDKDLTEPPSTPAEGAAYIIPTGATGVWAGKTGQIAQFIGGAWRYVVPLVGWLFYVVDEDKYYAYRSSTWAITAL